MANLELKGTTVLRSQDEVLDTVQGRLQSRCLNSILLAMIFSGVCLLAALSNPNVRLMCAIPSAPGVVRQNPPAVIRGNRMFFETFSPPEGRVFWSHANSAPGVSDLLHGA